MINIFGFHSAILEILSEFLSWDRQIWCEPGVFFYKLWWQIKDEEAVEGYKPRNACTEKNVFNVKEAFKWPFPWNTHPLLTLYYITIHSRMLTKLLTLRVNSHSHCPKNRLIQKNQMLHINFLGFDNEFFLFSWDKFCSGTRCCRL